MASRYHSRKPFQPRAAQKPKSTSFEVKIIGEISEKTSGLSRNSRPLRLQDLRTRLQGFFGVEIGESDEESRTARDHTKQYLKCKLVVQGVDSKPLAFSKIRQTWCTEICNPGNPFWLESCESNKNTFGFKAATSKHSLQPLSCSLGSFVDRGTFVEHYNTMDDASMIEDVIVTEFEHDTKLLTMSFHQKRPAHDELFFLLVPNSADEFRVEFNYRQFEEYIVVDDKDNKLDIYIPMIRPPKVFTVVVTGENKTSDVRCVTFLRCSQEVLGNSSVLRLRFASTNKRPIELITRLGALSRTVYFAAMATKKPRGPTEVPVKPEFDHFDVGYALECLLSRGFKVTDRVSRKFYDTLRSATLRPDEWSRGRARTLSRAQICRALYQLIAFVEKDRFCSLETILEQMLFGRFKRNVAIEFEMPKHYVYVPRIIITPTQNYLVQPELVAENRVVREYGHKFAMRIAFRDEEFSKLTSSSDSLKKVLEIRVERVLKDGFHLCGRHFEFLACSNSQLRDHGAWLYAHDGKVGADTIRSSLGQLDNIRCVATYVSRMGQCFSSTKESVKVNIEEDFKVVQIDDIEIQYNNTFFPCCGNFRSGTYTFSDGIGKISQALAEKVAVSLDLKSVPSAYQIRYGGCKGMLALDTCLPQERNILMYRKSMSKFDSQHKALEICDHSKPSVLYLNRQCITLLSGLGVPDKVFIRLQDTMLTRLAAMLLYEDIGLDMLSHTSVAGGMKTSVLRNSGILVTCEPFFRSLLLAIYKSKLSDLLRRARIAIPQSDGRLMVGVLDESKILEYGQVFIRYTKDISKPDQEVVTLTGEVVVTKNPCFHPGDMRKFQAVDVAALHHFVNCIVFPAKGSRPHTDEISGSDLDGDKYFVTWHKQLIPPQPNEDPMDFASPPKKVLDRRVNVDDMIKFVAEYIKNDQLGVIANAHLVHADSEEDGIKSEKCIKLAHMHSDAVDFPKTGECPSLTPDLRPDQYPDFMMKGDKPRYKSQGILGKLFQKCNQLERARNFMSEESPKELEVDQELILQGYQQFTESAIQNRDHYNTKLGSLMALYGLKDEGEVLTGCLSKVGSRLSGKTDDKFEVSQLIQASVASLRNNLKNDFYEEFGSEENVKEFFESERTYPEEVLLKASAWYAVTYMKLKSPDLEGTQEDKMEEAQENDEWSLSDSTLVSFPWIVAKLLAHIKTKATKKRKEVVGTYHELHEISELISRQAKNLCFNEGIIGDMADDFEMRQDERDRVFDVCARSTTMLNPMPLLGASMTGLNIRDKIPQPLQLYLYAGWNKHQHLQYLDMTRRSLSAGKRSAVSLNTAPPASITFTENDLYHWITADPQALKKSVYIYLHILRCPRLLHLLLVIMHWGRKRYMIGSARDSFMAIEDLAILFIVFCEQSGYIEKIPTIDFLTQEQDFLDKTKSRMAEEKWKTDILYAEAHSKKGFLNNTEPGITLIKFLESCGMDTESSSFSIASVLDPVGDTGKYLFPDMSQEHVQRFTDAALHAFHEIAQCRGLDSILKSVEHESLKEVQETMTLPYCTWGALRFAEDFVAQGLSTLTGAKVNIRPAAKGGGYIMEVLGNYITLHKCQVECHRLERKTNSAYVYNHTISGGSWFIFLGQTSGNDSVTVKKLDKDFAVNRLNVNGLDSLTSSGEDERKLLSAVVEQLDVFKRNYVSYLHGSKKLTISIEYGSIYVTNAHAWVLGSNVQTVERTLSQSSDSKNHGRNRNALTPERKFIFYHQKAMSVSSRLPSLGEAFHVEKRGYYVVEIKAGKHHDLKIVYDNELSFKKYQFEPFKWLVADLKTTRPPSSRSRDIDLRFLMTSARDLDTTEVLQLPIYETFGKTEILIMVDGQLEVLAEYRRRIAFVYHVVVDVYNVEVNGSEIFVEERKTKKYKVNSLRNPKQESVTLRLYAEFKSDEVDSATQLTRNILSAGKIVKPV